MPHRIDVAWHGRGGRARLAETRFRLGLLAGFDLTRGGISIRLSTGPQHLLAYLALSERSLRRVHVAGVLWADASDERAAGNLRSALWRLRLAGLDLVGVERDYLRLSPDVVVDVREVSRLAKFVTDPGTDVTTLGLEELLVAGELLPGWYDDWVVLERERQRQICLHLFEGLCQRWTRDGQFEKAVMAGLAAVAQEPLRESANRVLMRAYLANGNTGDAIRQYLRYKDVLWAELRLEPSGQMMQLVAGCGAP